MGMGPPAETTTILDAIPHVASIAEKLRGLCGTLPFLDSPY